MTIIKIIAVPIKVRVKVTITETITGTVKFVADTPVMEDCVLIRYVYRQHSITYLSLNCCYLNYSG